MNRLFRRAVYVALSCSVLLVQLSISGQNGPWKINLKEVELASFVEEVASITGKTFVVDPRIKGTVTVISDTQLDADGVYSLLLSVLKTHEFSLIESDDVVEIIQSSRARTVGGSKAEMTAETPGDLWVTHVVDAGHLDPSEIVKSLRQLAPQHAQFSAIAESNAVLISDRKSNVDGMLRVVEHLKSSAARKTIIVKLKHVLTTDVIELLQALHEDDQSINVIGNDVNNTLILRGTDTLLMDAMQSIDLIDQPSSEQTNTRVFRIGHGVAADVSKIVSDIVKEEQTAGEPAALGSEKLRIAVDESQNAIVVKANPAMMSQIAALIDKLDQRQPQVLIEAALVEVDLSGIASAGVEFAAADEDGDSIPAFSTSLDGVLAALLSAVGNEVGEIDSTDLVGAFNSPTLAISQLDPTGLSFGAIINALSTMTYANLLSTPSVMAMNNHESDILVGQNVPFRSGSLVFPNEQSVSGLRPTNREDIGNQLTVTPSIHDDLSVRMTINATIEVLQDTGIGIGDNGLADVVTNKRELNTVVVAENKQTIVLGGLIRSEARVVEKRVPLLGNVPLLGRLFRSETDTNKRTMLLIFLRPTVVSNADDADAVTDRKYREYWEVNIDGKDDEPQPIDDLFKGNSH